MTLGIGMRRNSTSHGGVEIGRGVRRHLADRRHRDKDQVHQAGAWGPSSVGHGTGKGR
jgi:hypothetical protein